MRTPFAADAHALALDFVTVFCRLRRRGVPLYGAGPDAAVGVLQGDAPLAEAEYELFAQRVRYSMLIRSFMALDCGRF